MKLLRTFATSKAGIGLTIAMAFGRAAMAGSGSGPSPVAAPEMDFSAGGAALAVLVCAFILWRGLSRSKAGSIGSKS